jgi:hypothetical protein
MSEGYILLRIDPHIWNDQSLNYPEKIILNLVYGFTAQGKCCLVSDDWISAYFGIDSSLVSNVISMLSARGFLCVIPGTAGQPRKMCINIPGEPDPCLEGEYVAYTEF